MCFKLCTILITAKPCFYFVIDLFYTQSAFDFHLQGDFYNRVQQVIFHSSTISYALFQNNVREILKKILFLT